MNLENQLVSASKIQKTTNKNGSQTPCLEKIKRLNGDLAKYLGKIKEHYFQIVKILLGMSINTHQKYPQIHHLRNPQYYKLYITR